MDEYIQTISLFKPLALSAEQPTMSEQTSPLSVNGLDIVVYHLMYDDFTEIFIRPINIGSYPYMAFNDAFFLLLMGIHAQAPHLLDGEVAMPELVTEVQTVILLITGSYIIFRYSAHAYILKPIGRCSFLLPRSSA